MLRGPSWRGRAAWKRESSLEEARTAGCGSSRDGPFQRAPGRNRNLFEHLLVGLHRLVVAGLRELLVADADVRDILIQQVDVVEH